MLYRKNRFSLKKLFLLFAFCLCVTSSFAQSKDEQAVRTMLTAQVTEWNKGNIDGYMKGYWENDSLLFIGAKGPRYGYQTTLKRYKEAYPDAEHMGKLTSTITRMDRLSKDYYFIVGKWALKRIVGDVSGSYTLLLKKIDGQWVIICDHSS
jgi:ketosteroid isomerase-like protein